MVGYGTASWLLVGLKHACLFLQERWDDSNISMISGNHQLCIFFWPGETKATFYDASDWG